MTAVDEEKRREELDLAAATLAHAVGSLMDQLVGASDLQKQEIAERMMVTPSRVSQLLSGDGNLRIATLARIADACGWDLSITATPRDGNAEGITVPARTRRRRRGGTRVPVLRTVETPDEFYAAEPPRRRTGS